ncbi:patatin-like phospholipase family protein [Alkalimonas mucilaginosa]|uniref:Patatin-like phospholipase family protein n=1 Tax=Alkalimonas mucilaginosa TaxID=3057676 RepID=A0ABU7JF31_9GAMM|nr:patatin-like phospholipase family protein [Alkalimonas sp. MEB004]MEE2023755.1 patatin-like phospholipase family protein [Alkalimonas sp. MEB004]
MRLRVLAGPTALAHIQQHGLNANDITTLVGASGGPKWFSLFGLDQYLTGEFFQGRQQPLQLLGSSAGAWRFACYAQQNPVAASQRFCDAYSTLCYPAKASSKEITDISMTVIKRVFPDPDKIHEVINNPLFKLNFTVARARALTRSRHKVGQLAGLSLTAAANLASRRHLRFFFERCLFYAPDSQLAKNPLQDLPTRTIQLSEQNLLPALQASGSIPLVLDPVQDIPGAGRGLFYDGGVTDYHFDWPFSQHGLVLYPHFYPYIAPGWFDKSLPWRRKFSAHYHNVVLLCPTADWVASLPGAKIPDRKDFNRPDKARIHDWREVIARSHELAEDFKAGHYQLEPLC